MESTNSNISSTLNLNQITEFRKSQTSLLSGTSNNDETGLQSNEVSY